jgi:hypothetical protein
MAVTFDLVEGPGHSDVYRLSWTDVLRGEGASRENRCGLCCTSVSQDHDDGNAMNLMIGSGMQQAHSADDDSPSRW